MTCLHDFPAGGRAKLRCMTPPGAKARATLALSIGFMVTPLLNGATPKPAAVPPMRAEPALTGCLPAGNGFLRARIRGAMNLDVDLKNAELECEGSARPDGNGIRLSFAGPLQSDGRRLRMVFGVSGAEEGDAGSALPTNLTVIFEGEKRLFATRGDDKCTVDKLQQERVGALGGDVRSYRVIASGFCIDPANALNAQERIVVSSFDFAGRVTFTPRPDTPSTAPLTAPTQISQ
jgi:hypothetical protein